MVKNLEFLSIVVLIQHKASIINPCFNASKMLVPISRSGLLTFFNRPCNSDHPQNEILFHLQ